MKKYIKYILLFLLFVFAYSFNKPETNNSVTPFTIQQVALDGNNINAWFYNTGIFDQDLNINNHPGFEWPKGSGSYAIFTAGLTIAGYVNNQLRMAAASYRGEYLPGHILDSAGIAVAETDTIFRIWKVSRWDNMYSNYDWAHWGLMIPYGAPFVDVNHNGVYEPLIDTPGISNASQTIFVCLTDGFPSSHNTGEGFGGGTAPLYIESHFTAWCYNYSGYQDIQFFKWIVINKNNSEWDSTQFSIVSDPDDGCSNDDYIGCDTVRSMGYCYNGEDVDCSSAFRYPVVVPAVGFKLLNLTNIKISSFTYFNYATGQENCTSEPGTPYPAFNLMRGLKIDLTPWVYPPGGNSSYVTKFVYSGDPETGIGWTEGNPGNPTGSVLNCGGPGHYTGEILNIDPYGERRFVMSFSPTNNIIHPGDTSKIVAAQLIAQGTSRFNSVTKLKQFADFTQSFYNGGFVIGNEKISSTTPDEFRLYQNFPNPFNPVTKIKFSISNVSCESSVVSVVIYDILGKEIATLVNEKLNAGTYEIEWNGTNYPSGVYFYKLVAGEISITKKMVIVK